MRKKRFAVAIAAATFSVFGVAGAAHADMDTYTQHSVEIGANNQIGNTYAYICNYQSAANSYLFWAVDDITNTTLFGPLTVNLGVNQCFSYSFYGSGLLQVFASSEGNWTFGTNPIASSFN